MGSGSSKNACNLPCSPCNPLLFGSGRFIRIPLRPQLCGQSFMPCRPPMCGGGIGLPPQCCSPSQPILPTRPAPILPPSPVFGGASAAQQLPLCPQQIGGGGGFAGAFGNSPIVPIPQQQPAFSLQQFQHQFSAGLPQLQQQFGGGCGGGIQQFSAGSIPQLPFNPAPAQPQFNLNQSITSLPQFSSQQFNFSATQQFPTTYQQQPQPCLPQLGFSGGASAQFPLPSQSIAALPAPSQTCLPQLGYSGANSALAALPPPQSNQFALHSQSLACFQQPQQQLFDQSAQQYQHYQQPTISAAYGQPGAFSAQFQHSQLPASFAAQSYPRFAAPQQACSSPVMPAPQQIAQFRPSVTLAQQYAQPQALPAIQHFPQGVGAAPQALPYLSSQSFAAASQPCQAAEAQLPQLTYNQLATQSQAFIPQQFSSSQNFAPSLTQGPIQSSLSSQQFALQQLGGQPTATAVLSAPTAQNANAAASVQFTPEQNAAIEQAQQAAAAQIAQAQAQAQQQRAAIEQAAQQVQAQIAQQQAQAQAQAAQAHQAAQLAAQQAAQQAQQAQLAAAHQAALQSQQAQRQATASMAQFSNPLIQQQFQQQQQQQQQQLGGVPGSFAPAGTFPGFPGCAGLNPNPSPIQNQVAGPAIYNSKDPGPQEFSVQIAKVQRVREYCIPLSSPQPIRRQPVHLSHHSGVGAAPVSNQCLPAPAASSQALAQNQLRAALNNSSNNVAAARLGQNGLNSLTASTSIQAASAALSGNHSAAQVSQSVYATQVFKRTPCQAAASVHKIPSVNALQAVQAATAAAVTAAAQAVQQQQQQLQQLQQQHQQLQQQQQQQQQQSQVNIRNTISSSTKEAPVPTVRQWSQPNVAALNATPSTPLRKF